jgi:hypothetical protein
MPRAPNNSKAEESSVFLFSVENIWEKEEQGFFSRAFSPLSLFFFWQPLLGPESLRACVGQEGCQGFGFGLIAFDRFDFHHGIETLRKFPRFGDRDWREFVRLVRA